jgi:hypothetical protein
MAKQLKELKEKATKKHKKMWIVEMGGMDFVFDKNPDKTKKLKTIEKVRDLWKEKYSYSQ